MISKKKIKVGIGFATGRKNFQKVLQTYIYSWKESGLTGDEHIELNLLVAYDLKYSNTKSLHYTNIHRQLLELIDETYFLGSNAIKKEIQYLIENNILNEKEAQMLFGTGYAAKRNIIQSANNQPLSTVSVFVPAHPNQSPPLTIQYSYRGDPKETAR